MSERLERFKEIFFTPPCYVVMNSFSTHILKEMDAAERQEAERLLLEAETQGTTDPRAIQGLAELKSRAAVPLLRRRLPPMDEKDTGWVIYGRSVIGTALALWQIEHDPAMFWYPATFVRLSTDKYSLIDACVILRRFPFSETLDVLRPRLLHKDMLVRCHAVQTMMFITGLNENECSIPEPAVRIMSEDPVVWQAVVSELEGAIRDIRLPSIRDEVRR